MTRVATIRVAYDSGAQTPVIAQISLEPESEHHVITRDERLFLKDERAQIIFNDKRSCRNCSYRWKVIYRCNFHVNYSLGGVLDC